MEHLGDITQLKGNEIPKVDIITGGSPCQDLSVAGKREGLAGERSGLFMEQIRLIKEMRESDRADGRTDVSIRPRFMVWENVPGAFSSNKGEDFRCVLEETAKIADSNATIPRLKEDRNGKQKWSKAGAVLGDGWSIAWRVHDAQFWGVPQRRKRIALVADFGGTTAPEILFERKGMSGDSTESREEREDITTDVGTSTTETSKAISFQERAGKPGGGKGILIQNEHTGALSTLNNQSVCYGIASYESNAMKSANPHSGIYEADTSRTLDLNGGSPACNQGGMAVVQGADIYNGELTGEKAATLTSASGGTNTSGPKIVCLEGNGSRPSHKGDGYAESETMYTLNSTEHHAVAVENHPADSRVKISEDGMVQTLSGRMGTGGGNVPMVMEQCSWDGSQVAPTLTSNNANGAQRMPNKDNFNAVLTYQKCCGTVDCNIAKGTSNQLANQDMFVSNGAIVRRLTPMECERLQGYPDGWSDIGEWYDNKGKKHKDADSPRYKALGNSIALPFWEWMAKRMVKYINHEVTMGSLFDGIGGFPLVFSRAGCKPVFASEIEEFPIAVTKLRFKE